MNRLLKAAGILAQGAWKSIGKKAQEERGRNRCKSLATRSWGSVFSYAALVVDVALALRWGAAGAWLSQRTETNFETPGSCIVTP